MTTPSQTFTVAVTLSQRLAENGARVVGFLAVAIPVVILSKGMIGPTPTVQNLPLPYVANIGSTVRSIDDRELDCLAANIFYESRNQPAIGQLAVGMTTYIRARDADWPDDICGVVHQPRQFSWVSETKQNQKISNSDFAYLNALDLATQILSGDFDNILPVFAPTHFHTTQVNPGWNRNLAKLARINDHIFYE